MKSFSIVAFVLFLVCVVIFGPFLTIWAANTLFPSLAIPYTFDTWLAVVLLGGFFRGTITTNKG